MPPYLDSMTALAALSHAIRTTLVLILVGVLAFGSLAGSAAASAADHHSAVAVADGDQDHALTAGEPCPAGADTATHDMDDGACCIGTCTTILGILPVATVPLARIGTIEPFDPPVAAQDRNNEFVRPPSLTI